MAWSERAPEDLPMSGNAVPTRLKLTVDQYRLMGERGTKRALVVFSEPAAEGCRNEHSHAPGERVPLGPALPGLELDLGEIPRGP